ncbi:DNA-directed RNA polymerase, mitochondrial, partial [Armadillidium nasatum]
MSSSEKREAFRTSLALKKRRMELNSLWCDTLYKLSLANHYRDCVIWLPQNMDFRGRTYPVPPHLTHVSADVFRSILCFAHGKKLGKEGIFWLKLHVVNLTGKMKKKSIEDRLKFCEEIMEEIFDSAKNPLNGNKWWAESDEPWQTLAACKDVS